MSATFIHTLPVEIHAMIFRFLDPASHLDFALADKTLYARSNKVLKHHQECFRSYRLCAEWDATTLVDRLRAVAVDHIAAWHVRTVEGLHAAVLCQNRFIDEPELGALADLVHATMHANSIPAFAISRIRSRNQEALLAALVALCPQLHTLKLREFHTTYRDSKEEEEENEGNDDEKSENLWDDSQIHLQYIENRSHNLFCNYILAVRELPPQPRPEWIWPPGLNSLRAILIGFPPIYYDDLVAANVAPIFLLPNIRTIYLAGLFAADEDDDGLDVDWDWNETLLPEKSSTVEHLFIEAASSEAAKYAVGRFVQSAQTLKTFIVKNCEFTDFDALVGHVSKHHDKTLETFIFDDDEGQMRGYRCSRFIPEECFDRSNAVRIFTVDIEDVRLESLRYSDDRQDGLTGEAGQRAAFIERFSCSVPENVEVLIYRSAGHPLYKDGIKEIEDALVQLVEKESCPSLRNIYLDEILISARYRQDQKDCIQRIVQWGKRHSIEVAVDPGSTQRYIAEVCDGLFDLSYV
ncbi:MAG: hypothetical protein M1820_003226 [Bogoriella megaspora]|nr:MAG: hypothetical protein M1820_003226 [Bogoriella megaspora]